MKEVLAEAGVPTAPTQHSTGWTRPPTSCARCPALGGEDRRTRRGQGVLVAESLAEAIADVEAKLSAPPSGSRPPGGDRRGMAGPECSLMALCDGRHVVALAPARTPSASARATPDRTRRHGAFSPIRPSTPPTSTAHGHGRRAAPRRTSHPRHRLPRRALRGAHADRRGPKVLEYNVRFGDPEAECVLVRLASDPFELLASVAGGSLQTRRASRMTRGLRGGRLPRVPRGDRDRRLISGLDQRGQLEVPIEGVTVFHAGRPATQRAGS